MVQQITINGKIYTHKDVEITDYRDVVFNMLSQLKPMEYCRYYDKYIFRNEQGQVCACYVDDLSNMFLYRRVIYDTFNKIYKVT